MTTTALDWLTHRNCGLQLAPNGRNWLVLINNSPQYVLCVAPAKGTFTCGITQSVSGKRIDSGQVWPTADDALKGGLDDLRAYLGW